MSEAARAWREWGIAVALAAGFAFTGIANHALQVPDEPRVAGIAWEMQHTGGWVPHLSGTPFLEHPPLFYAVVAGFIRAFGATDGVARLPSAIASFLTALLVFWIARRVADRSVGIPALLALVGISGFARYSHRAVVDPLLMLFSTFGYCAYVRAVFGNVPGPLQREAARPVPGWLLAVYVSAALAFWVKGPIGVVVIAGPIAVDALLARRWRVVASPVHIAGVLLLAAACAAWPITLYRAGGGDALSAFAMNNVWYRIDPTAGAGQYRGGHVNPFWYYPPRSFQHLGSITVFIPAVAVWLWRGNAPSGWRMPALRFLAWVFPIGMLLLSIPGTKRTLYLLPFEPPLAVAVGAWIAVAARSDALRSRVEAATNTLCAWITRVDLAAAASGACRAPYRLAMLFFAVAITWNVIGLRFFDRDREFEPMMRAIDARVEAETLFVLSPPESLLGALSFYTGRIPPRSYRIEDLERNIAQSAARFLLAPLPQRDEIAAALGSGATFERSWKIDHREFALFALSPALAALQQPDRD